MEASEAQRLFQELEVADKLSENMDAAGFAEAVLGLAEIDEASLAGA